MLEREQDGARFPLAAQTVVGREASATIPFAPEATWVSRRHASLRWSGERWLLRDLGSRNGSWVDGRQVEAGTEAPLTAGSQLAFGREQERWILREAGPPRAFARSENTWVEAQPDGAIVLPGGRIEGSPTGWRVAGGPPVADGAVIRLGRRAWRLWLPALIDATVESRRPEVDDVRLQVGGDEARPTIAVLCADASQPLAPRAHTRTLAQLARLRIRAAADGEPPAEQGWIHHEDLQAQLGIDRATLNTHVSRIRKAFAKLGLRGAAEIIERRPSAGTLRVGVPCNE